MAYPRACGFHASCVLPARSGLQLSIRVLPPTVNQPQGLCSELPSSILKLSTLFRLYAPQFFSASALNHHVPGHQPLLAAKAPGRRIGIVGNRTRRTWRHLFGKTRWLFCVFFFFFKVASKRAAWVPHIALRFARQYEGKHTHLLVGLRLLESRGDQTPLESWQTLCSPWAW